MLCFERGFARQLLPIHILKDARLGIDVNHYMTRLLGLKKEPFLDAIGGFPQSLKLYIESDLQVFKEFNITPIFVFSGNYTVEQFDVANSKDITPDEKHRNTAWAYYADFVNAHKNTSGSSAGSDNPNFLPSPLESFREYQTPFSIDSIFKDLVDYFIDSGLEYIRAPYFSWVQLAYLYEVDYIDAIYGPTETLLLPNIPKFIVGLEFPGKEFRFIDKSKVLNGLNITQEQLLDISVSIGCDLQPHTFPFYNGPYHPTQLFNVGLDIINSGGSIYGTVLSLNDELWIERFQKGIIALKYMPVLKLNGRVELQNPNGEGEDSLTFENTPPTDLHEIIGQRLPHEFYFYQSIGLIDTKVLEAIVFGVYFEAPPLEAAITTQYKNTVKATVTMFKNKEINLLTQNMARYFQVKKIKFVKSFDSLDVELTNRMTTPLYFKLSHLVIRSDEKKFSLEKFLSSLENDDLIGKSAYKLEDESQKLKSDYEITATSLLRTLYLLEFFDFDQESRKIKENKWASALYLLKTLDSRFQEQYLLFLIFFKMNPFDLHEDLSANLVGGSKVKDASDRKLVQLVSRLATLISPEQKTQNYSGPISRSLLSFRSCIDTVKINSSELFDSVLVNSLSNEEVAKVEKSNDDWKVLVRQLPFRKVTPNTILGIVVQLLLDNYYNSESTGEEALKEANRAVLEYFNTPTSSLINLSSDLKNGFTFVTEVYKIIQVLAKKDLVKDAVLEVFEKANDISHEFLRLNENGWS